MTNGNFKTQNVKMVLPVPICNLHFSFSILHFRALLLVALLALCAGCAEELPQDVLADVDDWRTLRSDMEAAVGGAAATAATVADPTGWATITGTFRIAGNPPQLAPLVVDKDQQVCGSMAPNQTLVVNNGAIQNMLVFLDMDIEDDSDSAAPKWVHADYAATRTAAVPFDQEDCVFLTHVIGVRSTQTLQILNSDTVGHNNNIQPTRGAKVFNQTIPATTGPAGAPTYVPGGESPQPFPISCSIHPWMSAWMISRNNPYFAVSAADGTFEIANLPAGVDLDFRAWQERAGFIQKVTVNGQPETWSKGRFQRKLNPGETVQLEIVIDASVFE